MLVTGHYSCRIPGMALYICCITKTKWESKSWMLPYLSWSPTRLVEVRMEYCFLVLTLNFLPTSNNLFKKTVFENFISIILTGKKIDSWYFIDWITGEKYPYVNFEKQGDLCTAIASKSVLLSKSGMH